jgi:hypothetical protein
MASNFRLSIIQDWTKGERFYTMNYLLMHTNPFRVVFMSDPIPLDPDLWKLCKHPRSKFLGHDIMFPIGLIVDGPDTCVVSAHLNDQVSVLLRLTGFRVLFEAAVAMDRTANMHMHVASHRLSIPGRLHRLTREQARSLLQHGEKFHSDK